MPTIAFFNGIKINLYMNDHLPPHFHVYYAEYKERIVIETLETYKGDKPLPNAKRRLVIKWVSAEGQQKFLFETFYRLNTDLLQ